ncbi:MAG: sigma-70 factor domain-containing protein, partial [Blastopirellula sp. JB062]
MTRTHDAFDNDDFEQDEVNRFPVDAAEENEEQFEDPNDESQIDDPVRMYLMQMGEIAMLSRQEEVDAARQIEFWRTRFRHAFISSDFILEQSVQLLEQVRDGKLRIDRTVEVSVTNAKEKKNIMRRIGPNLITLLKLLSGNVVDFRAVISKTASLEDRRAASKNMIRRRAKAVRLIEELNLRTNKISALLPKLREISERMDSLLEQIDEATKAGVSRSGQTVGELRTELR